MKHQYRWEWIATEDLPYHCWVRCMESDTLVSEASFKHQGEADAWLCEEKGRLEV